MWSGGKRVLLKEYLKDKEILFNLRQSQLNEYHEITNENIKYVENKIYDFISKLSKEDLKSLIYMSLDMENNHEE